MPQAPTDEFLSLCERAGVELEDQDAPRLGAYLDLLLDATTRVNLTAIRDPDDAWRRHIFDSLTLLPYVAQAEVTDLGVVDVGAGGGTPSIPLAICLPDVRFTLVEATGKKAEFLRGAIDQVGLDNVSVIEGRAEAIARSPERRDRFDVGVARALGPLNVLVELVAPFVRPAGALLAIKGERIDEELEHARAALNALRLTHVTTDRTETGRVAVFEKIDRTPRTYPRRDGEPKRDPIGGRVCRSG